MARPLLSIIVPSYNHEAFLGERFASIYSQGFDGFEIIVLDDASTDNSVAVIQRALEGKPHTLALNQANSGSPFKQWLRGVNLASGRYLWIAESDDSCCSSFLSKLLPPLERGEVSLAYTKSKTIDSHGAALDAPYWPALFDPHFFSKQQILPCRAFLRSFLSSGNCIPSASSVVFKIADVKERILAETKRIARYRYVGDWIFWALLLRIYDHEQMLYVSDPLSWHREHGGTTRAFQSRESEKRRIAEYSDAINQINNMKEVFSYRDVARSVLASGSWDWSYDQYLARYRPSSMERIIGYPLSGIHRLAYFRYQLRRPGKRLSESIRLLPLRFSFQGKQ